MEDAIADARAAAPARSRALTTIDTNGRALSAEMILELANKAYLLYFSQGSFY
jgi:hypothetical protein